MTNRYIIDSDTFQTLTKKREVVKNLSRKMILESKLNQFSKIVIKVLILMTALYFIHHYIMFGHLIHFH